MGVVRLSRPRVVLRAALLAVGGAYMAWRAWAAHRAAAGLDPADALLRERFAVVWALVAVLALATSAVALLALRTRHRRHSLHLGPRDGGGAP